MPDAFVTRTRYDLGHLDALRTLGMGVVRTSGRKAVEDARAGRDRAGAEGAFSRTSQLVASVVGLAERTATGASRQRVWPDEDGRRTAIRRVLQACASADPARCSRWEQIRHEIRDLTAALDLDAALADGRSLLSICTECCTELGFGLIPGRWNDSLAETPPGQDPAGQAPGST